VTLRQRLGDGSAVTWEFHTRRRQACQSGST